jgi:phosphopantothenoylcysteine decarboxylase/phosphopantothenate--cysteine ligase
MTAAIADFRPVIHLEQKVKTTDTWTLDLMKTEDILSNLGQDKGGRLIVGFALETDDAELNALAKLQKKSCDLVVSNGPAAFASDVNAVTIYNSKGRVYQSEGVESKRTVAQALLKLIADEPAFAKLRGL